MTPLRFLRSSRKRRVCCLALPFIVGFAVVASAAPQWQADGIPVCTNGGIQQTPLITSDGAGGAYVAWVDYRNGRPDVYLQRVTNGGAIATGWPTDGLGVCTGSESQDVSSLAQDGSGGVYVAWTDFRDRPANDADVYVQRVLGAGVIAPGWPSNGLAVASLAGVQDLPRLTPDGEGGIFIAWDDERSGGSTTADVYLQHILPSGDLAPSWPPGGKNLSSAPGEQLGPQLVSDGQGGVFVAWSDTRDFPLTSTDTYASRLGADGALHAGWITDGNAICTAPGVQGIRGIAPDGSGGIYVAWQDWRAAPPNDPFGNAYADVFLQRVSGTGALDPAWLSDGLPVCTATYLQQTISLDADASGGALVCWEDYRSLSTADVYVQRVAASGTPSPGWPSNGLLACTAPGYQVDPELAPDGLGGAYLAFESITVTHVVVAQHLTGNAAPAPGWPAEGIPVAMVPGTQDDPAIVADGLGGAIAAWSDTRSSPNGYDIYAHRLGPSGPTPVLVSLVSAEVEPGLVRLTWHAADGASLVATVERRTEASEWQALEDLSADGNGRLFYEDHAVTAGARYAYRLAYRDGADIGYTAETWVGVPALRFALRGLTPNPSAGDPVVRFTLPTDAPAALELFDLNGRLVLSREVGSLGTGTHHVRLGTHGQLPAGVYALRLRQGEEMATTRAAIIR